MKYTFCVGIHSRHAQTRTNCTDRYAKGIGLDVKKLAQFVVVQCLPSYSNVLHITLQFHGLMLFPIAQERG